MSDTKMSKISLKEDFPVLDYNDLKDSSKNMTYNSRKSSKSRSRSGPKMKKT